MYKPRKNLLTILFAAGTLMFSFALPAKALEYKLPGESVEKIIINQNFNNRHLEETCITEFYKDGSIVTKMDENSDSKIEWEKKEEQLDDKTRVTTYTTRGYFSGTSVENKLKDGTIRINFLNEKGKLTHYFIKKTDDKGKKIRDFYCIEGTLEILESRETEWIKYDGTKVKELGHFIGKDYNLFERVTEETSPAGAKKRTYYFDSDDNADQIEIESKSTNRGKTIYQYHRNARGKWELGDIITEVSIELKKGTEVK